MKIGQTNGNGDLHVNVSIVISAVAFVLLNSVGMSWWASNLTQRVSALETESAKATLAQAARGDAYVQIAHLDEQIKLIYARQNLGIEKLEALGLSVAELKQHLQRGSP